MQKLLVGFFVFLAAMSGYAQSHDVAKTWEGSIVYVPGSFLTKSVSDIEVPYPMPVVIFMHGCTGIGHDEHAWARFLKNLGFIVIMPNSFASPGRVQNCNPTTHTTNLGLVPVNAIRPWEAEYAAFQVRKQPWADKKNIFLMGHSEGGMAASLTRGRFNGVIISGFICHFGVFVGPQIPVLAISFEKDPYFSGNNFHCSDKWGIDRHTSRQIVLPGSGHSTVFQSAAMDAVESFLKVNLK